MDDQQDDEQQQQQPGNYGNSNNSNKKGREPSMREEIRQSVDLMRDTPMVIHDRVRRVRVPVFRDINPAAQMLPQVVDEFTDNGLIMDASENRPMILLPEEFFSFDSAETSTLLSLLLDSNHTRLARMLDKVHIRAMLREDRYYQIVDDPSLYFRSKCSDMPAFHNRVVLYLTTPGLLIYLKQTDALGVISQVRSKGVLPRTNKMITRRESRQSKRRQPQSDFASVLAYEHHKQNEMTPLINPDAYQYATYVHCYDGDILRFQLDFLAVKRQYQEALPILMDMNWQPNSPSLLLYRRRYYQYMTPFLDWVDLMRYHLKTNPNLSVTGFYEKLLDLNSEQVDIDDLRCFGHTMLEIFDLRRISKDNCPQMPDLHGMYAGRKVYRDKDPRVHNMLVKVYGRGKVVRPVIPNACSPVRRFLVHLHYYDRRCMTSLPQMLALVDYMLQQEFFAMHPICRTTNIRFEPLVFQIFDFVWSMRQNSFSRKKQFLRQETWDTIRRSEDGLAWYQRWDVFNCICLLFSILQNSIERDIDEGLIERLIHIIIDVLRSSEYLEVFMSYSYFDTYLGISSAVNCVPNLSLHCLLRVLHTIPFHLNANMSYTGILDLFSDRFWRTGAKETSESVGGGSSFRDRPRNARQVSEFFMTRPRRASVRQAPTSDTSDVVSGMSAIGSTGAVVLFQRDFDRMPKVAPEEEAATVNNDAIDKQRREDEEQAHLVDFRQREIDYRYAQVFTEAYCMATGRPRVIYDESMTYQECLAKSLAPYTPRYN